MNQPTLLLMSGLDGTAKLFDRFVAVAPAGVAFRTLPLPSDGPQTYPRLADWLAQQIGSEDVILVAEPPVPRWLGRLPDWLHTRRPPKSVLRLFLTGGDGALAEAVSDAVSGVDGRITAERIAAVLSVDVTAELQELSQPILYLRGTRDRLVSAKSAQRISALKPLGKFVELAAPHMLLQTHPNEAWRHITAFVASLAEAP
jgi:pimeloyl-ACP methyl ester carboxylesterase